MSVGIPTMLCFAVLLPNVATNLLANVALNITTTGPGEQTITLAISIINQMSGLVNSLKRVLVLMAMLFLIENLVNFWVLTSSYVYLQIKMPDFLKDTINSIYEDYNESFLAYLGFYIPEPNIWTALPATSCGSRCQFNFVDFFMQPLFLLLLTLVELWLLSFLVKYVKSQFRIARQTKILSMINQKPAYNPKENQFDQPTVYALFQSNKVRNQHTLDNLKVAGLTRLQTTHFPCPSKTAQNQQNINPQNEQVFAAPEDNKLSKLFSNFATRLFEREVIEEVTAQNGKHWSQEIYINKMQKVGALIINYMSGLLLPAYTVFHKTKPANLPEKLNLLGYYSLFGAVLLFPPLYLAILLLHKQRKKGRQQWKLTHKTNLQQLVHPANEAPKQTGDISSVQKWQHLKESQIDTFFQYFINIGISLALGFQDNVYPFYLITTSILSVYVIYGFSYGSRGLTLESITFAKINSITHKLTFWLFNFVFLLFGLLDYLQESSLFGSQRDLLETVSTYLGLVCLALFIFGGAHQLIEFAVMAVHIIFKILYMFWKILFDDRGSLFTVQSLKTVPKPLSTQKNNILNIQTGSGQQHKREGNALKELPSNKILQIIPSCAGPRVCKYSALDRERQHNHS